MLPQYQLLQFHRPVHHDCPSRPNKRNVPLILIFLLPPEKWLLEIDCWNLQKTFWAHSCFVLNLFVCCRYPMQQCRTSPRCPHRSACTLVWSRTVNIVGSNLGSLSCTSFWTNLWWLLKLLLCQKFFYRNPLFQVSGDKPTKRSWTPQLAQPPFA